VDRRVFRCNGKRLFLTFFLQNIAVREYSGEVFFLNAFHEYDMKIPFITAACALFLLSGCVAPATYEEYDSKYVKKNTEIRSSKQAIKVLNQRGLTASVTLGTPKGAKNKGFNTQFLNMKSTWTDLTIPMTMTVDLGTGPAADRIRQEGKPVFTFIRPRIKVTRHNYNTKRTNTYDQRVLMPKRGICEGYYVILSPENGYQRSWTFDRDVKIRKSGGKNAPILWEIKKIEDVTVTRTHVSDRPFRADYDRRGYFVPCYPDEATRTAWTGRK